MKHSRCLAILVFLPFVSWAQTGGVGTSPETMTESTSYETQPSTTTTQPTKSTQEKPDLSERMGDVVDDVQKAHRDFTKKAETIRSEKRYFGGLEWTPIDLLVPVKWGAHVGYNAGPNNSYELEYIRGSLSVPFLIDNLGSVVDDRFSFTARKYYGGAFNFFYGLDYLRFRINLGDEILSRIAVIASPDVDVLEIASFGAHVGIGNRWALGENVTFGVDWFAWTQPFYTSYSKSPYLRYATNEEDEDNVRGVLKVIEYFPRFTILRFSLGATF